MASVKSNTYETRYLQLDVWEISVDQAGNSSQVGWKLTSAGGYSSYYYIANTAVTINGQQVYSYDAPAWDTNWATKTFPVKTGEVSGQVTVPHNSDGKKTLSFNLSTRVYISTTPADFSGTLTLTEIVPSQPVTVSAADMVLGENCRVTWTPAASNLYYKVMFIVGTKWQAISGIYPNRTTAYTFGQTALPVALARGLTNASSGEMTVVLTAHRDFECTAANQVGSEARATCRVTVPNTQVFAPDLLLTLGPAGSPGGTFAGLYIQGKTGISAVLEGTPKYDAALQAYQLTVGGTAYDSALPNISVAMLTQYGSVKVTGMVRDSRGLSAALSHNIQVLPYARPKVLPFSGQRKVIADRCDVSGNPADSGAYLKIQAKRSYSPVRSNNVQKNYCLLQYRYRADTAASWSDWTVLLDRTASADEISTGPLIGSLQPKVSYQVQIQALDDLGEASTTTITVSTEKVYCHRDGARGSFGFGKLVEETDVFDIAPDKVLILRGGLTVGEDARLALLDLSHPVGSVLETTLEGNPGDSMGGSWVSITSMYTGVYRWQRTE